MPSFSSIQPIKLTKKECGFEAARGFKTSVYQIGDEDHKYILKGEGEIDNFCNEFGFYQETATESLIRRTKSQNISLGQYQKPLSASDGLSLPPSFLNLFKHYLTGFNSSRSRETTRCREKGTISDSPKLSTDQIIRLAGERFIENASDMSTNIDQHMRHSLTSLSIGEKSDVELVQLLFAAAEKIFHKQTERACSLLSDCKTLASNTGTPVQRTVFYFTEALTKKIERETRKIVLDNSEKIPEYPIVCSRLKYQRMGVTWYQKLPFIQVMQFAAVQAMLENVKMDSKVHMIDLQIRSGVAWAVLMHALGKQEDYKIKKLKLTVVETIDKEAAQTACTHLQDFAKSLNLFFSYKIIFLSDMKDLTEELFELDSEEIVVVYASIVLRSMIARPVCLERLMKVMNRIKPSIMVVIEVEANHNSPSFINRFIEALFYFGAFFDSIEDCLELDDQYRMDLETELFRHIHNIVAAEGTERLARSVNFEVWKAFFERFGMVEEELSESSLLQAQLVFQTFHCLSSCYLGNKGKGLVLGWKGTPIFTLSAWRFG